MDVIWGSTVQYTEITWGWQIAVYLFLAGLSAGALITSIIVKWFQGDDNQEWDGLVKAGALLAPFSIILGQGLLIFDLAKPLSFYLLLIHYQLGSVMSIGVILLALYTPLSVLFAIVVYKEELVQLGPIDTIAEKLEQTWFEGLNFIMAIAIASYTGFLLSAMVAKPLFNIAVLPLLFLVSGLSVGICASILLAMVLFRDTVHDASLQYLLNLDFRMILFEGLILFLLFTGLYYHGGNYAVVAQKSLTDGIWAKVFWIGVVGVGLLLPLVISVVSLHKKVGNYTTSDVQEEIAATIQEQFPVTILLLSSGAVIMGGILLRFYILYAGQIFF